MRVNGECGEGPSGPDWRSETVGEIARRLDGLRAERIGLQRLGLAFGPAAAPLLLMLLSAPFVIPVSVPGMSAAVSLPLFALALGLATPDPRLAFPRALGRRRVSWRPMLAVLPALDRVLARLEGLTRPRWTGAVSGRWRAARAAAVIVMVALIAAPLPTGNTPAAAAIVAMALGTLRHDGMFVVIGYGLAVVALAWNAGIAGLIVLAGTTAFDALPI